jgi:protein subunit release factor A
MREGVTMEQYSAEPTVPGIQQLSDRLERLRERYKHISHDLRDKTANRSILEIKQLEREFLIFDMRKLEKLLAQMKLVQKLRQPTRALQRKDNPLRRYIRVLRSRYHVSNKPIHLV